MKTNILIGIDNDVALLVRRKYSSNRQLSSLLNNFLKNLIDFENPEEEKLKEKIKDYEKQILKFKCLKAENETILESMLKQKNKEAEDQEAERLRKAKMLSDSLTASGFMEDLEL